MADIAQQMPGGSPAVAIDEAKRQKLLELVRGPQIWPRTK
jgi:hypothetical protein